MKMRYKALVGVLILIIVALLMVILLQQCGNNSTPTGPGGGLYEDPNAEDIREPDAQKGSIGNIAVPGFEAMTIKANQTKQNIWLYNPEKNNCYFLATIMLPDGTEVYKSALIAPGKAIYTAEFTRTVPAGTYENAILQYDFYTLDGTQANGTKAYFTLEVEK